MKSFELHDIETLDQALLVIQQLLKRNAELEEQLGMDSHTSSKPPSSDGPAVPRRKHVPSGKKRGAQSGHKGHRRAALPAEQVDHIFDCFPPAICSCGAPLTVGGIARRHQVFDLPPLQPVVSEYRLFSGKCPQCKCRHQADFPVGVPSGQFGPNALALLGTLAGQCHLTQRKIQALFRDVFGLSFSIGAISEAYEPVADALLAPSSELEQAIKQAPVKHADETTHQSHGQHLYLWAMVTDWGAHYKIQPSRAKWAAQALLGDALVGTVITDRYGGYHWVDTSQRQVCWAHLLRDFTRIANRPGLPGRIGHRLLGWSYLLFRWHGENVPPGKWQRLQQHIRQALQAGTGLADVCTRTANTCRNLLAMWESLWHFIPDPQVPPTNNLAERAIRSVVLRRKISYVTRSGRGMRFIERVFAIAYTCQRQGRSLYEYLRQAIDAHLRQLPFPSLVPSSVSSR